MKQLAIVALAMGLVLAASTATAETRADDILGVWLTDKKESKIEVSKKDGKYFGKITWLEEPNYPQDDDEAGVVKHDRKNPDEALQSRPIVGLKLLTNFIFDRDDQSWEKGKIYDPEVGKTYKCVIHLGEDGTLNVRGYIGIRALGRSTTWTRPEK